eukprot:TRINITY_DN3209_c0_g1_i3.p2 TRINITY_DN3209_c0_g1~~TRINITY_DN3209_c0_g1_i3.p2  ORF type:complete len:283 (+),score=17.33 TRINITY_DN3209_c0_g1_i3:177-1025(+)
MPARKRAASPTDTENLLGATKGVPDDVMSANDPTSKFVVSLAEKIEVSTCLLEQLVSKLDTIASAKETAAPVNETTAPEADCSAFSDAENDVLFDEININTRSVLDWAPHIHDPERVGKLLNALRSRYSLYTVTSTSPSLIEQEKSRLWDVIVASRVDQVWIEEQLPMLQLLLNRIAALGYFPPVGDGVPPRAKLEEAKVCADTYSKAVDGRTWREMTRRFMNDVDDKVNKARAAFRSKETRTSFSSVSSPMPVTPQAVTKRRNRTPAWDNKRQKTDATSKN